MQTYPIVDGPKAVMRLARISWCELAIEKVRYLDTCLSPVKYFETGFLLLKQIAHISFI